MKDCEKGQKERKTLLLLTDNSYSEECWLGLTTSQVISSTNETIGATIQINSRKCASGNNPRKSTITHEIGHLFGLSDNPSVGNNKSLMRHERDRDVIYQPHVFDILNAIFVYDN